MNRSQRPTGLARLRVLRPLVLLALLPACSSFDPGPDDHPPPGPAEDLRVRQEPGDTVRVGQTVRLTAVFADSTGGWQIVWDLADASTKTGRIIEWQVPAAPGTYYGRVSVLSGDPTRGNNLLTFKTYVLP